MANFHDLTGRPGPANWSLGAYPEGAADLPVAGVSWYEAMAYAEFAGKSIPTVYEWRRAAPVEFNADVVLMSNFSGKALAPIGAYHGMTTFGAYDMAGNVKEWTVNASGTLRYALGGAWDESSYAVSARRCARSVLADGLGGISHGEACRRRRRLPASPRSSRRARRPARTEKPVDDQTYRLLADLSSLSAVRARRPRRTTPTITAVVDARDRVVQGGLCQRSCDRASLPAEERGASVSDRHRARRHRHRDDQARRGLRISVRVPDSVGTRRHDSGLLGDARTRPVAEHAPRQRRDRPRDQVVARSRPVDRLPADAHGHRRHAGSASMRSAGAPRIHRACWRSRRVSRPPRSCPAGSDRVNRARSTRGILRRATVCRR